MNPYFPHLFQPLKIKNLIYKNRIEASPMGNVPTHHFISAFPDYGGVSFYDKSLGGAASLHIVAHGADASTSYISNGADPFQKYQLDIRQEQLSVGHQKGAITSFCVGVNSVLNGVLYGPSEMNRNGKMFAETPKNSIKDMIKDVALKASKAIEFGYDAITLDIAHDSLVSQFMAPAYNCREDEYGQIIVNRFRFGRELVQSVRKAVGQNTVIELRLSAVLHIENSYTFEEMLAFIKDVEDYIDIVNVVSGMDEVLEANVHSVAMMFQPHMKNVDYAKQIKQHCNVYVSVGGSIMTPQEAESILADQKADLVMLGRSLLADPFWVQKAKEGRSEDIVPCLRCNYCYHIATKHMQTMCSVNPRVYREHRVPLVLEKASHPKKVAVIGGGPAGCKVALIASEKGHYVDLYEKEKHLGGQLNVAQYGGNHKIDLKRYRDYLEAQVMKSNIHMYLSTTASKEELKKKKYDAIIVAIGAEPIVPPISGIDRKQVFNCIEAFENIETLGDRIVIIGGGSIGVEMGIHLSELNKKVELIELSDQLASNANILYKYGMNEALRKAHNLHVHLNMSVSEILEKQVVATDQHNQRYDFEYDNVIVAVGMKSKSDEAFDYYGLAEDTYVVGDCKKVAKVLEATNEAYFIAANL